MVTKVRKAAGEKLMKPHRADENGVYRPGRLGLGLDRSRVGPGRGRLEPRPEHADLGRGGIELDGRALEPGLRGALGSVAECGSPRRTWR